MPLNPYDVIGVPHTCTNDELKRAYKKARQKAHPDKHGGSVEQFQLITRAYEFIIKCRRRPKRRAEPKPQTQQTPTVRSRLTDVDLDMAEMGPYGAAAGFYFWRKKTAEADKRRQARAQAYAQNQPTPNVILKQKFAIYVSPTDAWRGCSRVHTITLKKGFRQVVVNIPTGSKDGTIIHKKIDPYNTVEYVVRLSDLSTLDDIIKGGTIQPITEE